MAKHALVGDGAGRQCIIAVVARAHGPCSAVFRIPGERQFEQCPPSSLVQVRFGMIPGSHHVIDAEFSCMDRLAVRIRAATAAV